MQERERRLRERSRSEDEGGYDYPTSDYDEETDYGDPERQRWMREGNRGYDQESGGWGGQGRDRDYSEMEGRPGANFSNPSRYRSSSRAGGGQPFDQDRGYGSQSRYSRWEHDEGRRTYGDRMGGVSGEDTSYGEEPFRRAPSKRSRDMRESFAGRGPKGYHRSDSRIYEDIAEDLTWSPSVDASNIELEVKDGVVTLRGQVTDRYQKRMAEDIAESVPGVRDVSNELRLQSLGTQQQSRGGRQEVSEGGSTSSGEQQPAMAEASGSQEAQAQSSGGSAESTGGGASRQELASRPPETTTPPEPVHPQGESKDPFAPDR